MSSHGRSQSSILQPFVNLEVRDHIVEIRLDGRLYLCQFRLNVREAEHRRSYGYGAITSTGVLHALWNISEGVRWSEIDDYDKATLQNVNPGLLKKGGPVVSARYRPPGNVILIGAHRSRLNTAIQSALAVSPVYRRAAIWNESHSGRADQSNPVVEFARRSGLGLLELGERQKSNILSLPAPQIPGRRCVYRWFVAELAFAGMDHAQIAQASS